MNDHSNSPVLLVYETNKRYGFDAVQQWFDKSSFNAYEAADVFEAIEELSDYTIQFPPDVILLRINSRAKEYPMIQQLANDARLSSFVLPTALFTDGTEADDSAYIFGNLGELKAQLDKARPAKKARKARAA
jgi:hypothetical protein